MAEPEIRTALTKGEADYLSELADGWRVLECGSNLGSSAIRMAATATSVTTIDRHTEWQRDTLYELRQNVRLYRVKAKVVLIVGEFADVLPLLPAAFYEFGFLDGSDGADEVTATIQAMARCLEPAALLVVHDYDDEAVRVGVAASGWTVTDVSQRLAILERT